MINFDEESNKIQKICNEIDNSIQMNFKDDLIYSCEEMKNQYDIKTQECYQIETNINQLQTEIEQICDLMNKSIETNDGVAYSKKIGR